MCFKRTAGVWVGAVLVQAGLGASVYAQQAGAPAEQRTKSDQVETIVVTATKRPEDVTKVPLSITVINGEALEEQHIVTFADLTRAVPNLSFSGGAQGGDAEQAGVVTEIAGERGLGCRLGCLPANARSRAFVRPQPEAPGRFPGS